MTMPTMVAAEVAPICTTTICLYTSLWLRPRKLMETLSILEKGMESKVVAAARVRRWTSPALAPAAMVSRMLSGVLPPGAMSCLT